MEDVLERLRNVYPDVYDEHKGKLSSYQLCLAKFNSQLRKRAVVFQSEADDHYELNVRVNWKSSNDRSTSEDVGREDEFDEGSRSVASITSELIRGMMEEGVVERQLAGDRSSRARIAKQITGSKKSKAQDPIVAHILAQKRIEKQRGSERRDNFRNYMNSYNLRWNLLYPGVNRNDGEVSITSQF